MGGARPEELPGGDTAPLLHGSDESDPYNNTCYVNNAEQARLEILISNGASSATTKK